MAETPPDRQPTMWAKKWADAFSGRGLSDTMPDVVFLQVKVAGVVADERHAGVVKERHVARVCCKDEGWRIWHTAGRLEKKSWEDCEEHKGAAEENGGGGCWNAY